MKLWFASGNAHKKRELAAILAGHTLVLPGEAGIAFDPEETGATFLENGLIKARALYDLVREPVIADDSGLCVDALDGRPGIYSARYGADGGKQLDSAARNALLVRELGANPVRTARFVCSMVLMLGPDRFFVAQETLEGEILTSGRGSAGFGYDPILYLPEYACSVAELPDQKKNQLSHRGKAGRRLAAVLSDLANTPGF
jgi:XTP/dITP diphosphohydrolase